MITLTGLKEHRFTWLFAFVLLVVAIGGVSSTSLVKRGPGGTGIDQAKEPPVKSSLLSKDLGNTAPVADLPLFQDRIVKTGSITLKVKKGKFNSTYDQVITLARASGGYVAGSSSLGADDRLASGSLTIRVPSKNFEAVLAKLRRLGQPTALDINSQDVSTEYVDLDSRLRHWRAQETILLNLMEKAANIADSITVQQQLSQVQLEIEQITGRLNHLKDQTSYSSIQATINEPGVVSRPLDQWGFKTAVVQGAHAFVDTINGLIVLMGYLSPLLLAAGLAGLIWTAWRGRPRLAGPAQ